MSQQARRVVDAAPHGRGLQAVEDLLWVVNSPSFVTGSNVAPPKRLARTQIDELALLAFLDDRPAHRVGRYFENLLHFWLREIRRLEIVGAGVQIRKDKRTIGELDFLYRDEAGALVHCEAAVKFFLHHPRNGKSHFPGPNATDDFERKTAKLFDQQLEFSRAHYPDVEVRHAFVKGIVFYRDSTPLDDLPERMAPDHLVGRWIRASELDTWSAGDDMACAIAEKPHWLAAPLTDAPLSTSQVADQLRRHFGGDHPHPVMVSLRAVDVGAETARMFVVSDDWPGAKPRS